MNHLERCWICLSPFNASGTERDVWIRADEILAIGISYRPWYSFRYRTRVTTKTFGVVLVKERTLQIIDLIERAVEKSYANHAFLKEKYEPNSTRRNDE